MPIGEIQPPTVGISEEPTVCLQINREWVAQMQAMIRPASFPEWWSGTLEDNRFARQQVRQLMYVLTQFEECGDMKDCCVEPAIIYRINPTTGNVQQSSDDGSTWTPAAGGFQSVIVQPVPPVTNGVSATKCDAALNCAHQVDLWITQVTDDFDTATTLLEFAIAVIEAIAVAVLAILSLGTLTPLEALVLPTIGAAAGAAFGAGKAVFTAYWTDDNKKLIKCAFVHNIGDDGSFTDAQFSAAWNEMNSELPSSPAKMLFMGFLSSVGRAGMNAMAASGYSTDGDCDDCSDVCPVEWTFYGVHDVVNDPDDPNNWSMVADGGGAHVAFSSGDKMQGCYCDSHALESWSWWPVGSDDPVGGTNPKVTAVWNMDAGAADAGFVLNLSFSKFPIT